MFMICVVSFFEIGIDCDNMVNAMFNEALKGEATTVEARNEVVGTSHEVVCDLATIDD